jgi:hypothetical protein
VLPIKYTPEDVRLSRVNFLRPSVTFAQPEAESLNQMRFCMGSAETSNIVGGGTAHEFYYFELATGEYSAWDAGRLW